ncbi:hypothetical protein K8M09_13295 [Shinella zoogloeoides]|nr:hypothetical protein [Shinella zoogloeoides]UEX80576.1 hypothetical protein K8M09_13295 [Shinella zoogloeoides]
MQDDVAGLREPGQFQFEPVSFLGILLRFRPQRLSVRAVLKHEVHQLLVLDFDLGQAALYVCPPTVAVSLVLVPAFDVPFSVKSNALRRGKLVSQRVDEQVLDVLQIEGLRVGAGPAIIVL